MGDLFFSVVDLLDGRDDECLPELGLEDDCRRSSGALRDEEFFLEARSRLEDFCNRRESVGMVEEDVFRVLEDSRGEIRLLDPL